MDPRLQFLEKLYAALVENDCDIKQVAMWNQNIDFLEQDDSYELPAVFVEFMPITWQPHKEKDFLRGGGSVRLHVITPWQSFGDDVATFTVCQQLMFAIDRMDDTDCDFRLSIPQETHTNHNHAEVMETIEVFYMRYIRRFFDADS